MTRTGPAKAVDPPFASGRLRIARAFLAAAEAEVEALADGNPSNPAMSQIVHAAIAYTDALTATLLGKVNRRDHGAAAQLLREALGNRLPKARAVDLERILDEKDDVQYGMRVRSGDDAKALLQRLQSFAVWAEEQLARAQ